MNERRVSPRRSSGVREFVSSAIRRSPTKSRNVGFFRLRRALALGAWCSASLLTSSNAGALESPIALGEVGASAGTRTDLARAFRDALEQELGRIDFGAHRPRRRYVLSATLVKLDSVTETRSVRATCVVSIALRREQESTLQAVIQGRATAEEPKSESESARESALSAAVHSALRRVPETVKASEH